MVYGWIGGVIVGAVVLAALVGGCGEGSEASSSLTKAEFVKRADAACAKRKDEWKSAVNAYQKEVKAKGAEADLEAQREIAQRMLSDSMLPALEMQLEELEELEAPEGIEGKVEKMVKMLSKAIGKVEDEGIEVLIEQGFAPFEKEAEALGVTCPL